MRVRFAELEPRDRRIALTALGSLVLAVALAIITGRLLTTYPSVTIWGVFVGLLNAVIIIAGLGGITIVLGGFSATDDIDGHRGHDE
jgi:hypothetical protein